MRKLHTKLLCVVMGLLLLFAVSGVALSEEEQQIPSVVEGARLQDWAYKTEDGEVTLNYYMDGYEYMTIFDRDGVTLFIPAEIKGNPVTGFSDYLLDFISGQVNFELEQGSRGFVKRDGMLLNKDETVLVACDRMLDGRLVVPEGVETIGANALRGCKGLTEVELPDTLRWIGNWAFEGCTGISEVSIPDGLERLGFGAFSGCSGLLEVNIPKGVSELGERTFAHCSSLMAVDLPKELGEIGTQAFYNCESMKKIALPEALYEIGDEAFYGCSGLSKVEIPSGTKAIREFAFYHCVNLMEIVIPKSVKTIGESVFRDCPEMLVIRCSPESTAQAYAAKNGYMFLGMQ